MAEWIEIADGGLLLFEPALCTNHEADDLFLHLRDRVVWRQETIFGRPAPRLNAWFSDEGLRYRYSGLTHTGTGWSPELAAVRERVEVGSGHRFNSLLLNRYRDGRDSIGFHADDEPELGTNPAVATVSFGAGRDFVLKHRSRKKEKFTYRLGHGSLLVMAGTSQHHWLHGIPKTDEPVGERISLTFRWIHPSKPTTSTPSS